MADFEYQKRLLVAGWNAAYAKLPASSINRHIPSAELHIKNRERYDELCAEQNRLHNMHTILYKCVFDKLICKGCNRACSPHELIINVCDFTFGVSMSRENHFICTELLKLIARNRTQIAILELDTLDMIESSYDKNSQQTQIAKAQQDEVNINSITVEHSELEREHVDKFIRLISETKIPQYLEFIISKYDADFDIYSLSNETVTKHRIDYNEYIEEILGLKQLLVSSEMQCLP